VRRNVRGTCQRVAGGRIKGKLGKLQESIKGGEKIMGTHRGGGCSMLGQGETGKLKK